MAALICPRGVPKPLVGSHMPPPLRPRREHGCGQAVAEGFSAGVGDYRCALNTYGFPEGRAVTEAASVDEGRLVAGRYRLVERIGQGGMGTVWRARDEVLGRQVAVKRLHVSPHLEADELARRHERTTREAQAAARINHPNVVGVHDVVDDAGMPCIVMEYVPSLTLGDAIKEAARKDSSVTPREAARIGRGMMAALRAAHSAGVLHRDVKPGNVLLGEDGRVVLTDFGIAVASGTSTLTKTGELVGSIDYLAPERVRSGNTGPRLRSVGAGRDALSSGRGTAPVPEGHRGRDGVLDRHGPARSAAQRRCADPADRGAARQGAGGPPDGRGRRTGAAVRRGRGGDGADGWPTLALGTVGHGDPESTGTNGQTEAPTRAVPRTTGTGTASGGPSTSTGPVPGLPRARTPTPARVRARGRTSAP